MTPPPRPRSGRVTLASTGVAQRLSTVSIPCSSVALKALSGSPDVGDSTVAADAGWPLEEAVAFKVDDLKNVYAVGTAGDVIAFLVTGYP